MLRGECDNPACSGRIEQEAGDLGVPRGGSRLATALAQQGEHRLGFRAAPTIHTE
jgi:hypothetical protein